jgi:hypothetical protein
MPTFFYFIIGAFIAFSIGGVFQGFVVHYYTRLVRWWEWAIWTGVSGMLIGPFISFFVMGLIYSLTNSADGPWADIFLIASSAIGIACGTLVAAVGQTHLLARSTWRDFEEGPFSYQARWALPVALSWLVGSAVALVLILPNRGVTYPEFGTFIPEPSMSYVLADAVGALVATFIVAFATGSALVRFVKRFVEDQPVGNAN